MPARRATCAIPPSRAANPYRIAGDSPWYHVVNVSGGRSSGFMLHQILDANGGTLPDRCEAIFANTGRERAETLDFIAAMGERWAVPITWLEFAYDPDRAPGSGRTKYGARVVSRETAALDGEPFTALLDAGTWLPSVDAPDLHKRAKGRHHRSVSVAVAEADAPANAEADRLPVR